VAAVPLFSSAPYPGLRPFRDYESDIFFGREEQTDELLARLDRCRFLAVTGASGCGKSSLVRAGMIPALNTGFMAEAGSRWTVCHLLPGDRPLERLSHVLARPEVLSANRDNEESAAFVKAALRRGPLGLIEVARGAEALQHANLLILVDQFEELFRNRERTNRDDADAFVALLLASVQQSAVAIYIVITMRSDYLGECAAFHGLPEAVSDGQYLTPRLTREQLEEAIAGPARVFGGRADAKLVNRLINEFGTESDQLPLLQHALARMWARRDKSSSSPLLTVEQYEAIGGFEALSKHGDEIYAELSPEQQRVAAIMFKRLSGSEDGPQDSRSPARVDEVAKIAAQDYRSVIGEVIAVAEAFRQPDRCFLAAPEGRVEETTPLDLSHESLIRQWGKLSGWVRDEHQSAETYRDIERSAKQFKNHAGNLLTKLDLSVARKWRKAERPNAAWAKRYGDAFGQAMEFLDKSQRHRFWRRGLATAGIVVPLAVIAIAVWAMFYEITVVLVGLVYLNPGSEFSDYNVKPQAVLRQQGYGETPMTIPGGQVVGTLELKAALDGGKLRGAPFKLIDALAGKHKNAIKQATWIADAGSVGRYYDTVEDGLEQKLKRLTDGNRDMSIVFYCQGARCWESYNACLRAIFLGYSRVYWYRGGLSAWHEADETFAKQVANMLGKNEQMSRVPVKTPTVLSYIPDITLLLLNRMTRPRASDAGQQVEVKDSDYYYRHGRAEAGNGDYDTAITDFSKAIMRHYKNADYYYQRGRALANKEDYIDAMYDLIKAKALDPTKSANIEKILRDPKYGLARGDDFYEEKDYEQAVAAYAQAIRANPKNADAYSKRGNAYREKGEFGYAIDDYTEEINLNPQNKSAAYVTRGMAYFAIGDHEHAIDDYDRAITIEPKYHWSYYVRGIANFYAGSFLKAFDDLDQASKLKPDAYTWIWLEILNKRTSQPSRLEHALTQIDMSKWPAAVIRLYLGKLTPAEVRAAAESGDANTGKGQVCEANFYTGELALLQGAKEEAGRLFRLAAASCPGDFIERAAAVTRLRTLGKGGI
jgi:PQQ-dependent catabolism-associated CXXCW motif protein